MAPYFLYSALLLTRVLEKAVHYIGSRGPFGMQSVSDEGTGRGIMHPRNLRGVGVTTPPVHLEP